MVVVVVWVVVSFWIACGVDVVVVVVLFAIATGGVYTTVGSVGHFGSFLKSHFFAVESHSNGKLHAIHSPFI